MSFSLARPSPAAGARQQLDELDALLQRMLDLPVRPGDEPAPPATAPEAAAPPAEPAPRAYPSSYMVVETNAPLIAPPPPVEDSPGHDSEGSLPLEEPVPGGRHDLVADQPEEDEAPPEAPGEEWVPFRSSWQPSAQTWGPLARTWEQALGRGAPDAPAAEPAPPFLSAPSPSPLVVTRPADEEAPAPRPDPAPAPPPAPVPPRAAGPLVWFNAVFDAALAPLGPPGRWLRGPAGRHALGVVGVGCLLAAAALVAAEGMGWTW